MGTEVRGHQLSRPGPGTGQFAFAALATYGTSLVIAMLSLGNVLIMAYALGPAGRGEVAFLMVMAALTSVVAMVSVNEANANLGGRDPSLRPRLATNSVVLAFTLGGGAALSLLALIAVFPALEGPSDRGLRLVALSVIPALMLRPYMVFLIRSDYRFAAGNVAALFSPVTCLVVNGTLAALGELTPTTAIVTWASAEVLEASFLVWYVARRLDGFGRPSLPLARDAIAFGAKTHLGRMMMMGNYRLDQWFIGVLAGAKELGLYSVAVAWSEALFFLPTALVLVQRPYLVRSSAREAPTRAARVFRISVLATVPLALGMLLLAPILTVSLFGADFRGSLDDLRILVPGVLGVIALKQLGNTLTAQRKPLLETAAAGVAFAATVVLSVLLIPTFGGAGAALASTIAYTLGGAAAAVIFLRTFRVSPAVLIPRPAEAVGLAPVLWRERPRLLRAGRAG